ncbi:hypothetical protein P5V15_000532 [Pogonomyrmex californicus]
MDNTSNKEDQHQVKVKEEKMETIGKIYVKQPHEILDDPLLKSTENDDVQRAIKGLREIPDEELKEFLDDEAFMAGLDVVDAWEGDEDKNREQDKTKSIGQKKKQHPRERHHPESKGSHKRKNTKDIERDKIRTKRDTESKLLAEKEKAIKHLLDSDNVVPPGTEVEAIQSIAEEQNRERAQREAQRKEHRRSKSSERYGRSSPLRRKTPDRFRLSPHRRKSPLSPDHRRSPYKSSAESLRSPYGYSPGRRKNSPRFDRRSPILSPDRRRSPRRFSGERRSSVDRRWSAERSRRKRADWTHERRRSRSRDRRSRSHDRRSRSMERLRRRSSRSPVSRRYSPRRRSRTRTRSRSLEKRSRKRSPFINELARTLRNEARLPTGVNSGGYVPPATMEEIAPLLNPPTYKQEPEPRPPPPPSAPPSYVHQPGSLPPAPPSSSSMLAPMPSGSSFINFEPMPTVPLMNFEPMPPPHTPAPTTYSSGPILYNQPNAPSVQAPPPPAICTPLLSAPLPSPQPVPPPAMDHAQITYNPSFTVPFVQQSSIRQFEPPNKSLNHSTTPSTSQNYTERGPAASYNEAYSPRQERMKTPEPPIISKPKHFEKTSLSSLLEASVSAKDSSNIPVLYPGFKPEIMQHCEQALCQLPIEDPRLKMKGRFFYDRSEENVTKDDSEDHTSNSILLQKSKTKIFWKESNAEQPIPVPKATIQMHQKICQTDDVETETKSVQVYVSTADFESQVYPHDLQQIKEEKRPIMDRLDWSARDTYEYGSKFREVEDLRWSLNNSSQRRTWNKQSPSRRSEDREHLDSMDHESRNVRLNSPVRSRDDFSTHSSVRDHYSREKYLPEYHRRSMERDDYHDRKSEHSRGESPMELEESEDEELMTGHTFQKGSDWHGKGKENIQEENRIGVTETFEANFKTMYIYIYIKYCSNNEPLR